MSFFANYRADRLIAEVKSSGNPGSPLAQKALAKLVALGPGSIEPLVAALTTAEKKETLAYVEALAKLVDTKTLPLLRYDRLHCSDKLLHTAFGGFIPPLFVG